MRFLLILLVVLMLALGAVSFVSAEPSCDKPLSYRIGSIDPRFDLTEEAALRALERAEKSWEEAFGKDLLVYDSQAPLSVNFIYDERQERTQEATKLDEQLKNFEAKQARIHNEYGSISTLYDQKLAAYEKKVAEYERRVREYNRNVERWNRQGGAPKDEYEELQDEEEELRELAEEIEADRKDLNVYAEETGKLAAEDQALVESYNQEVETFEERYGGAQQFDQGVYDGTSINIYQFREAVDLTLVLIHEFGHALGIDHVDDPRAIMYPVLEHQNIDNSAPLAADLEALRLACAQKDNLFRRGWEGFLSKVRSLPILDSKVSFDNFRNFTKTALYH